MDPAVARTFGTLLRKWFRKNGRDLPWRKTRDPYRILVSELMLQQTQVSRVVPKYAEFLETFPTLRHIARATPKRVTEAWSGLGYYARARNLHALAKVVTDAGRNPYGTLPADAVELRELPGIGAYTAGAVSSFAYERRAELVDIVAAARMEQAAKRCRARRRLAVIHQVQQAKARARRERVPRRRPEGRHNDRGQASGTGVGVEVVGVGHLHVAQLAVGTLHLGIEPQVGTRSVVYRNEGVGPALHDNAGFAMQIATGLHRRNARLHALALGCQTTGERGIGHRID